MKIFGMTDIGKHRRINQDNYYYTQEAIGNLPNLFVVADGMGGQNAGEVASDLAIKFFCEGIVKHQMESIEELIRQATNYANQQVLAYAMTHPTCQGMGTTLTVAVVDHQSLVVGHIGDSRLYRWRDNQLEQLTKDHSLVQELFEQGLIDQAEMDCHPNKNIITRSIGGGQSVEADIFRVPIKDRDCFLLCTDGLTNMVSDQIIAQIMMEYNQCREEADISHRLVATALEYGGYDNITVVVFEENKGEVGSC